MKKLIIALAAVAMAAGVQAATWTWGVSTSGMIMKPGGSSAEDVLTSGTAYLFANLTSSQLNAIVDDFAAGTFTPSGYEQTTSVTSGGLITKVDWDDTRAAGTSVDWTMVITSTIDGDDYVFISSALTKTRQTDGKNTKVTFNVLSDSSAAASLASGGYSGAGWYQAEAIPEPTTGLLVLLGVAGLALRRRRA